MTIKDKIIFTMLTIITLGAYPLIVIKSKPKGVSDSLSVNTKTTINIDLLLELLGASNIKEVTNTHTKVKVELSTSKDINGEKIKNMKGISGVFMTSTSITLLVGNSAATIVKAIKEKI